MSVELDEFGSVSVISLQGAVSADVADQLRERLFKLIDGGVCQVVVDCAGAEFISSLGIGVLAEAWKKMRACSGQMVLCTIGDQMQSLFKMTNIKDMFQVFPDRESALRHFSEVQEDPDGTCP